MHQRFAYLLLLICLVVSRGSAFAEDSPGERRMHADACGLGQPSSQEQVFPGAEWLRDPRFDGRAVRDVFDAHRAKEHSTRLKNIHTYFRKEFTLPSRPTKAVLRFSADDYAKVYISGVFVVQGPDPAYPFALPYYEIDVTEYLQEGRNCLAAHTYYHGLATRAFNSADNRSGLIARLHILLSDGSTCVIVSDGSWKCHAPETFSADRVFGYATQFNENIDLTKEPIGWRLCGFSDAQWPAPLVQTQDHRFLRQITSPLQHSRVSPVVLREKSPGRWFADFGTVLVGHTRIKVQGPVNHKLTVWHGEELLAPGDEGYAPDTVRHDMRCNCNYEDTVTLSGRDDLIEFYDYRGFRYVELLNAPSRPEVWVDLRHHPFDWSASRFDSSDPVLNGIWEISKRGVQMGCQGVMVDCAQREKGQYTGDAYMTVLSHLILTADPTLTKKAIIDWHLSQRFEPGMLCVAPGGFWQELAEWSLLWPVMLEYYYRMTGDDDLVRRLVDAGALDKLTAVFAGMENEQGLLEGVDKHKWVLVDWPANLRAGYDYDNTKNGVNTVVNAFYYGSLRSAASLARVAGRNGTAYERRAERLRNAINSVLLHTEEGVYIDGLHEDGTRSTKRTLHATSYPLHFGVTLEENIPKAVALIHRERLNCGIYGAPYVLTGLWNVGQSDLAYELLTSKDKHSWHEMLRNGATTTMEAWAPELKWNTSWCHPAGGTPVWLIVQRLLGLEPAEPGFRSLQIHPRLPDRLQWIEVRFPTAAGPIEARYEKGKGYRVTVPEGMHVVDQTPGSIELTVTRLGE